MGFRLRKIATLDYDHSNARTMVIGSDGAHLRKAYRYFLEDHLQVEEYFFPKNKGMIDSLVSNLNKDRPQHFLNIRNNLHKGVDRIIIMTHVNLSDVVRGRPRTQKRLTRVNNALEARRIIFDQFRSDFPKLKISCYIIVEIGSMKVLYLISRDAVQKRVMTAKV